MALESLGRFDTAANGNKVLTTSLEPPLDNARRVRRDFTLEHPSHDKCGSDACSVTKAEVLRFIEARFQMADRDRDGQLNISELSNFLRFVTHPDLRELHGWGRKS